jgi:hypothetical protein
VRLLAAAVVALVLVAPAKAVDSGAARRLPPSPSRSADVTAAREAFGRAPSERGRSATATTTTRETARRDDGRNYVADGVAAVLAVVAVVLLVRRRRQLRG